MFVRKAIYIYIVIYIYIYEALQLNYPDNLVSGASYTLNPMPTASCLPAPRSLDSARRGAQLIDGRSGIS